MNVALRVRFLLECQWSMIPRPRLPWTNSLVIFIVFLLPLHVLNANHVLLLIIVYSIHETCTLPFMALFLRYYTIMNIPWEWSWNSNGSSEVWTLCSEVGGVMPDPNESPANTWDGTGKLRDRWKIMSLISYLSSLACSPTKCRLEFLEGEVIARGL